MTVAEASPSGGNPAVGPASRDVAAPRFGPGFLRFNAWPYRAEMAFLAIGLLILLFYWRLAVIGDLDVVATIFWLLWPDAAFLPIGLAMRGGSTWPRWGTWVYNATHSFVVWAACFGLAWLLLGAVPWPLLGWAAHVAGDRAVGYYLRAPS